MTGKHPAVRLEYLRGQLDAENISYEEIAELQSLAEFIKPGDTQLAEAAGIPETPARHEWFDAKQDRWVSAEGYEVCQDHTGPRATCPFKHDGRNRTAG